MAIDTPFVTVVVPTYNRIDVLEKTLAALGLVDYPPSHFEVVVVDDGSTEGVEGVVAEQARSTRLTLRYERQSNKGPAAARNRGASAASGDVLIFIDNDIIVSRDFLTKHVATLSQNPRSWVLGRVVNQSGLWDTPFGRYRNNLWEASHHVRGDTLAEIDAISTQNVSLPTVDFHELGGFDEDFTIASGEDWELGQRARRAGIRLLYDPGIVVTHNDWAGSLESFCERQRLYSISDVLLWRKYGQSSFRARLVLDNAPIDWTRDGWRLITRKSLKRIAASRGVRTVLRAGSKTLEFYAPDTRWNSKLYKTIIGIAIFRGVREGCQAYPDVAMTKRNQS